MAVSDENIAEIKADPFPYMIEMINRSGIKLRKSRGKEAYTVDGDSLDTDLAFINRRKAAGISEAGEWLDRIDEYLKAHQVRKAKAQDLKAGVVDSVPETVSDAIAKSIELNE